MGIFRRRPDAPSLAASSYSVFDSHLTVNGDVETDGSLRVDGRLEGNIHRANIVVVGTGASIIGDVTAHEVVVGGTVTGNITATARVELKSTGAVAGNIHAAAILIHEGGTVQGRLSIQAIGAGDAHGGEEVEMSQMAAVR
jgi:cytoskeletal protein CcmA (bactofilin family)